MDSSTSDSSSSTSSSSTGTTRCGTQRSALQVLILGSGSGQTTPQPTPTLVQGGTEPQEHASSTQNEMLESQSPTPEPALVKRHGAYYLASTSTPARRGKDKKFKDSVGRRFNRLFGRIFDIHKDETKLELKSLVATGKSRIYTLQTGSQTQVVKLFDQPRAAINELQTQTLVEIKLCELWPLIQVSNDNARLRRPRVPRPVSHVFQRSHLGTSSVIRGYVMEYIQPLHHHQCRALVKKHMDPQLHETAWEDPELMDVRLNARLGQGESESDGLVGELKDRPVFFDQLWEECPKELLRWVKIMASTLAIMHWSCGLDAKGVEFRLGRYHNRNRLWLCHFRDCKPIEAFDKIDMPRMVDAVTSNPAWPRPATAVSLDMKEDTHNVLPQVWALFRRAYLASSALALREEDTYIFCRRLPQMFIGSLEAKWKLQAEESINIESSMDSIV